MREQPVPSPLGRPKEPGLVRRMTWWLASVDGDLMSHPDCRADWNRYSLLGTAVVITACLAFVEAFALVYTLYVPTPRVASACGLAWAIVVLALERLMLTSLVKAPDTNGVTLALMALPRIALAILLTAALSVPAEITLFKRRIELKLAHDHQAAIEAETQRIVGRYRDIPRLDSVERSIQADVARADSVVAAAFQAAACEADGTCGSGESGDGFRYRRKLAHFEEAKADADRVRARSLTAVAELRAERDSLRGKRAAEIDRFSATATASDDLLARVIALGQLGNDATFGATVTICAWLIRLVAALIELLPLGTKLLSRRSPYDAAYIAMHDGQRARWDAEREAALHEAALDVRTRHAIADSVAAATHDLIDQAAARAIDSKMARHAMRDFMRRIVDGSVRIGRRAATKVFATDAVEREIAIDALGPRRQADARVNAAEQHVADVSDGLNDAVGRAADLNETGDDPRTSAPSHPPQQLDAAD